MELSLGLIIGGLCGGLFILVFAGAGVFLIYQSIRSRQKAEASQGWPATSGQITDARVAHHTSTDSEGDRSDHYTPRVSYTYQVSGQTFEGSKIGFGMQQSFGSAAKAQAALTRFSMGGQVAVYYDPNNPAESVLERKAGGSTMSLILGIVFLVISLCLGCPVLFWVILAPVMQQ